jgi:HAD superfamily hydrolase (TIGR01544 family)
MEALMSECRLQKGIFTGSLALYSEKLEKLQREGLASLHIVSDFDMTLTKAHALGKRANAIMTHVREGNYLGEEYSRDSLTLRKIYHPIEMDLNYPIDEKRQKMAEWHEEIFKLLMTHRLSCEIVEQIARDSPFAMRDGLSDLLAYSADHSVPFLIFSAAIADIIERWLHLRGLMHANMHIISNTLEYDDRGFVIGIREPHVSTFNKTERLIVGTSFASEVADRRNVIVLGDSIGDLDMATGLSHKVVFSIGFLNDHHAQREQFLRAFDVVIEYDTDIGFVTELLRSIAAHHQ